MTTKFTYSTKNTNKLRTLTQSSVQIVYWYLAVTLKISELLEFSESIEIDSSNFT